MVQTLLTLSAVATGGALGALGRFGVTHLAFQVMGAGFPYGTLIVNVLGSFLMGGLVVYFAHVFQPAQAMKLFLLTGFLGAFTTFSAFSLDFVTLIQRGEMIQAGLYAALSVVTSIAALFAGMALVRGLIV